MHAVVNCVREAGRWIPRSSTGLSPSPPSFTPFCDAGPQLVFQYAPFEVPWRPLVGPFCEILRGSPDRVHTIRRYIEFGTKRARSAHTMPVLNGDESGSDVYMRVVGKLGVALADPTTHIIGLCIRSTGSSQLFQL